MGNYNKNLSDRHPQVKVKTFSNNKKDVAKNFMEGWTSSGQNLENYTHKILKKIILVFCTENYYHFTVQAFSKRINGF